MFPPGEHWMMDFSRVHFKNGFQRVHHWKIYTVNSTATSGTNFIIRCTEMSAVWRCHLLLHYILGRTYLSGVQRWPLYEGVRQWRLHFTLMSPSEELLPFEQGSFLIHLVLKYTNASSLAYSLPKSWISLLKTLPIRRKFPIFGNLS